MQDRLGKKLAYNDKVLYIRNNKTNTGVYPALVVRFTSEKVKIIFHKNRSDHMYTTEDTMVNPSSLIKFDWEEKYIDNP